MLRYYLQFFKFLLLIKSHNWQEFLIYVHLPFWLLWSNWWWVDCVLLNLTESHLKDQLLKLCWYLFEEDISPHLCLADRCKWSEILSFGFEAGKLRFISTQYDQFISEKSNTIFKTCFYGRVSLPVVFQTTTLFLSIICYFIWHCGLYLHKLNKNSDFFSRRHITQYFKFIYKINK